MRRFFRNFDYDNFILSSCTAGGALYGGYYSHNKYKNYPKNMENYTMRALDVGVSGIAGGTVGLIGGFVYPMFLPCAFGFWYIDKRRRWELRNKKSV